MFALTNVTLEQCTQEFAKAFAALPALPGERRLRPAHVKYLDNCRKAGHFVSATWAVVVDKLTGLRYRVNGQHSSRMLADCPVEEYPTTLPVTIEEYTSDDIVHDRVVIFEKFDDPHQSRTNEDVMGLYKAAYPELADITAAFCVQIASGIHMYEKGRKGGVALEPRRRGLYLDDPINRDLIQWASTFAMTHHAWMLSKNGVVAEMISSRHLDQSDAEMFWQLVFTESHPDPDHETRELSRTLRDWASKPRVKQDRFRKEAAKQWRRFHKAITPPSPTAPGLPLTATGGDFSQPSA